jgi:hypothetical protein
MDGWELSLQGDMIVLEVTDGLRTITRAMTVDEAEELSQALTDLIIEHDLDECTDDDDEDEAA